MVKLDDVTSWVESKNGRLGMIATAWWYSLMKKLRKTNSKRNNKTLTYK